MVRYSAASLAACVASTLDAGTGLFILGNAGPGCWPLAVPVLLSLPSAYAGQLECGRRNATVAAVQQLLHLHADPVVMEGAGMAGISHDQVAVLSARVNGLTCDGESVVPKVRGLPTIPSPGATLCSRFFGPCCFGTVRT